ncbi:MAG: glycosyltransferase [Actinomycetota bacterium]|nr:glycosyltransferase [Actinomycetota bacterium]
MSANRGGRIAIVVEDAGEHGGTERVSAFLAAHLPGAKIVSITAADRRRHYAGPLLATRFARMDVGPADLLLTFPTSGAALATPPPAGARHVAFLPGPPRALHGHVGRYLLDYPRPVRPLLALAVPPLRVHAARLVRRPNRILTYSTFAAESILRLYGRQAEVIPPPIRTRFFTPRPQQRTHFLAVARLVAHKRVDVLVDAFRGLNAELVIAGRGPWLERLRARAPRNVSFVGFVPDERLRELYRGAVALISPAAEEFGMVMAEAQACGTPVIAPSAGGAIDIVSHGETGLLLENADGRSIADAVRQVTVCYEGWKERCRASAERFAEDRFVSAMTRVVDGELGLVSARSPAEAPRTVATELAGAQSAPR